MDSPPDKILFTARQAADFFQTSIGVIVMWRNRGWRDTEGTRRQLPIAAHDERNRPLYRLSDLLIAECGSRQSRRRTGLPPRARLEDPYQRARASA